MSDRIFGVSNICTAFEASTIGSKVINGAKLIDYINSALDDYDESRDKVPGQHFIVLTEEAYSTVSSGVGPSSKNPEDYVIRSHREGPKMYLSREFAGEVKSLAVVVYTREAYMSDPDYDPSEVLADATHIIVAVLAGDGVVSPVTPYRFVHNLAGGNKEYECPEYSYYDDGASVCIDKLQRHIDWLEDKAKEVKEYWDNNSVVAD